MSWSFCLPNFLNKKFLCEQRRKYIPSTINQISAAQKYEKVASIFLLQKSYFTKGNEYYVKSIMIIENFNFDIKFVSLRFFDTWSPFFVNSMNHIVNCFHENYGFFSSCMWCQLISRNIILRLDSVEILENLAHNYNFLTKNSWKQRFC